MAAVNWKVEEMVRVSVIVLRIEEELLDKMERLIGYDSSHSPSGGGGWDSS